MIELIQFPWSPFCLVQRRILDFSGVRFKITNIPSQDRTVVWRLTRHRYYGVPILRDGRTVVFETDEDSQVIAKYLDAKLQLDLFPKQFRGVDRVLWRYIEDQIEGACFRLNDSYWQEFVPKADQLTYLRHKERKFGQGCLDQWAVQRAQWLETLTSKLTPFECMLAERPFLLRSEPHFIDFDLWGMLACFLQSGHYQMPSIHTCLQEWHRRMSHLKKADGPSEKLHT
ncbi:MAG TPA: glutathione S-transferase family protein [Candidatus Cybelea sp.]|nr:glutathione S-transferase family protein [Candidatus Cybelea sp.]